MYINKTGAQWRMLPKDYPPWQTVYSYYSDWNYSGVWEQALDAINKVFRKKRTKKKFQAMVS